MATTKIHTRWDRGGRSVGAYLWFSRGVTYIDRKRCSRTFAEALHEVFAQQGIPLEKIDFDYSEGWDEVLIGRAHILRGQVTAEQMSAFGEAFLRRLNSVREYTAVHQRQLTRPK